MRLPKLDSMNQLISLIFGLVMLYYFTLGTKINKGRALLITTRCAKAAAYRLGLVAIAAERKYTEVIQP